MSKKLSTILIIKFVSVHTFIQLYVKYKMKLKYE